MTFQILGTGSYLPAKAVTNEDLSVFLDTTDQWISERTGIRQRRVCTAEATSDMAIAAGKAALANSGVSPKELDLILCATVSGDYICPSMACLVQAAIGASCPAMDVNAACSGFLYMLDTAAGFFARGKVKRVLVIGAEQLSRVVDWTDRSTAILFGDGAGAAVLGAGRNYLASVLDAKGGADVIRIPARVGNTPFYTGRRDHPYLFMDGQKTFKFAVGALTRNVRSVLEEAGFREEDVSWVISHQANRRIIDAAKARLKGIPDDRFYCNIHKYGNTSSASIPIALDEMNRCGYLKRGDLLVMVGFGGGLTSAACLLRW